MKLNSHGDEDFYIIFSYNLLSLSKIVFYPLYSQVVVVMLMCVNINEI